MELNAASTSRDKLLREWRQIIRLYKGAATAGRGLEEDDDGSGDGQDDAEDDERKHEQALASRSPFAV